MPDPLKTGPLRRNWFHILVALADRDVHGSGIVRDVLDQTDGGITLWPATLYRTLDEIVAAGLILELTGSDHPQGASGKRRYFRITPQGRKALTDASGRMTAWAAAARRRLGTLT